MIVKRITPNKIKLGVHVQDSNAKYRFYSTANDVVVWFNYMYQANTYYSNDVLYIDINKSQVIPNETYTHQDKVAIKIGYDRYKLLNGDIISRREIETQEAQEPNTRYMILENNNSLYIKLVDTINTIRRLHIPMTRTPIEFTLNSANEYDKLENFHPLDGHEDRNTRPYHVSERRTRQMYNRTFNSLKTYATNGMNNYGVTDRTTMTESALPVPTINYATTTTTINATSYNTTRTTIDHTTPNNNYQNLLASYHGGVAMGNTKYAASGETQTGTTRYFGWELETELGNSNTTMAEYTSRLNDLMNDGQLGKMIKFERDGSLAMGGCEIISQPMTAKYMIETRDKFKEMMDLINNMGGTSHDNGRCGLHFHVSRASLTEDAINEIYFVVETFKKELIAFSRRTTFNYCAFRDFSNSVYNGWKYIDKDYFVRNKSTGHGCALNNANTHTLEFRFIRGTTNIQTFMASMELIDNICNMVMENKVVNGTTWSDIINYNDEYEDLKRYNERRNITSTKEYNNILDLSRSDR